MVEIARELELEIELKMELDCSDLIKKLEQIRSCFLWMKKESSFLRWNLLLMKMVEDRWNDKKGFKYYINLVVKVVAKLEKTDSNFKSSRDFPVGPVVKNPPVSCRGHRFSLQSGKIPHTAGQLSPCATTTEPVLYSLPQLLKPPQPRFHVLNKRSHCNEKTEYCKRE